MGKATIVSNLGEGKYTVKPRYYGGATITRLIALAGIEEEMQPLIDYWGERVETALEILKDEQWAYERCDPLGIEIEEQTKVLATAQAEAQKLKSIMQGYRINKASAALEAASLIKRIPSSLTIGHLADGERDDIEALRKGLTAAAPALQATAAQAWLNVEEMTVIVDDKMADVTFWQQSLDAAIAAEDEAAIALAREHLREAETVLNQAQRDLDKGRE